MVLTRSQKLPWVSRAECVYWGDLDTHGLRILSRVRALLPRVSSILMDEQTLLAHRTLWGEEAEQSSDTELPALCADEQLLYQRLKQTSLGRQCTARAGAYSVDYAWESLLTRRDG